MLFAAGLLFFASEVVAAEAACPAVGVRTVQFSSAVSGDAFVTKEGEEIRLAGILAPGANEDTPPDILSRSVQNLSIALATGPIDIAPASGGPDRYGRVIAQVFVGGIWLQ